MPLSFSINSTGAAGDVSVVPIVSSARNAPRSGFFDAVAPPVEGGQVAERRVQLHERAAGFDVHQGEFEREQAVVVISGRGRLSSPSLR
jgi:hypothetical protein